MGLRIAFAGVLLLVLVSTTGCIPERGAIEAQCGLFWPWSNLTCTGDGGGGSGGAVGPYVTLTADDTVVSSGAEVAVTADVAGAGEGEPTYEWSATCGTLEGTGASVLWTAPSVEGAEAQTCAVSCVATLQAGAQTSADLVFSVSPTSPTA